MSKNSKEFSEEVPWPIWLWLFLIFLAASLAIAFWAALGTRWAAISGLIQLLGLIYISQRSQLEIRVDESELRVGRAHIERKFLGEVEQLSADQMRQWRGPLADPAAYMALRFWISTGVKVEINDPQDPRPYWLISSKKAQPLVAALSKKD
jgi:hypothetical protein